MKTIQLSKILALSLSLAILCASIFTGALTVSAVGEDPLMVNDCSSLDGWTKTGGGGTLNVNNNGYGSDSAIGCAVNYGAFRTVTLSFGETPLDLSNYKYLEWDVRFYENKNNGGTGTMWEQIKAAYGTNGNNQMLLKLSSSATDYNVFRLSTMTTTVSATNSEWVHFRVQIDAPNTPMGTFDKSAITAFYFATTDGATVSTVSDGVIRLDNIVATGYQEPGKDPIALCACENTAGWVYSGTAAITNSSSGRNGNAVMLEGGYGILRRLTYNLADPINADGYKTLEWDMTALRVGALTDQMTDILAAYSDKIGVEVGDGTNTKKFSLLDMEFSNIDASWWHVALSLENSGLDLTNISSFVIYTNENGAGDTNLANTIYKFDNINITVAKVTPNGYDYAAVAELVIEDCSDLSGWTYYGVADHENMTSNPNGFSGGTVQVFGGSCKIGPLKYTFENPVNISRHGRLSWKVRFMNAPTYPDMWETVSTAYADYIKATLTDNLGKSYSYMLNDIAVEETATAGWYTMTVDLAAASALDFTQLKSFTFQVTDGAYIDTTVPNGYLRIDSIAAIPSVPLEEGDINADHAVDIKDLLRFKAYLADNTVTFNETVADLDGSGVVDTDDLVCMRKLLVGISFEKVDYPVLNTQGWTQVVKL
ncbi:MAG: dockerin type I repeat-containing protein [Clostridia bacterium]|nr:dockerin type I repeat-containing protein [Clostridia bacterium]